LGWLGKARKKFISGSIAVLSLEGRRSHLAASAHDDQSRDFATLHQTQKDDDRPPGATDQRAAELSLRLSAKRPESFDEIDQRTMKVVSGLSRF
jgi:hypothetical protein